MPELPEVETIRRGLIPCIKGRRILEIKIQERKSFIGEPVTGEVVDIRRRGKALLIDIAGGWTMMIHLRMTGQLIWRSRARAEGATELEEFAGGHPSNNFIDELPNGQTRVIFVFGEGQLFFNDQRKFGFVKVLRTEVVEQEKFIRELAKEPWEMSAKELFSQCQRHAKAPIKAVILDQKVIAGIGNIYADESLFYAEVHPATRAGDLTEAQVGKILKGACEVMTRSIESGGSTMATYVRPDGTTGDYLELFAQVFRREGKPCPRCGAEIRKTKVAGRGTHYCPVCQGDGRRGGAAPEGALC